MLFLIGEETRKKKIVFGWSPKCGCSHIRSIVKFLEDGKSVKNAIYDTALPDNIDEYVIILIVRNPYKRIVSGFLDKYADKNLLTLAHLWNDKVPLTFTNFVNLLIAEDYDQIDHHHFDHQISKNYDYKRFLNYKNLIVYDIENIDYKHIETLFNKKIPANLIRDRGPERVVNHRAKEIITYPVYDLLQRKYIAYKPTTSCFYNEDIKKKVSQHYKKDFDFLSKVGFNYDIYDYSIKDKYKY